MSKSLLIGLFCYEFPCENVSDSGRAHDNQLDNATKGSVTLDRSRASNYSYRLTEPLLNGHARILMRVGKNVSLLTSQNFKYPHSL